MLNAFICGGTRSPFGRHAGALARVRPDDLLSEVIKSIVKKTALNPKTIDDVIIGCGNQAGEDSRCVARNALLRADLPIEVPGTVIQRNCGSGLGAIISSAHAITCGEAELVIAGGVESMTRAPFVFSKAEQAFSKDAQFFDSALGSRFPNIALQKVIGDDSMSETADNLAREFKLTREECDMFAYKSQQKYQIAKQRKFFDDEITPITIPKSKYVEEKWFFEDEFPRPNTTLDSLSNLSVLNKFGVTTAGNASGINDGAVALVITNENRIKDLGCSFICRILSSGVVGVDPKIMGYGPVPASKLALRRAGLTISDMDVVEINEAFAPQVLACLKGIKMDVNDDRLNPNGGAISVGHPLGASGARLVLTAARQLSQINGRYALIAMCIGIGQGIAVIIERQS